MRGVNCKLMLYSGFFPCPLSIFLEKYNIFSLIQREEVLRGTDSRYGVTQISPMQSGCYCRFGLGSVGKMLPEACQRQVLQLGFAVHLLSKLHGSIVVLLHLREKLKHFFNYACNKVSKARGKGRCTTMLYLPGEEGILPLEKRQCYLTGKQS